MKGRVLWRKAMMPVSRLPLSLSFFFGIWQHRPRKYDNYFVFLQCTSFPLMTNFELFVLYVCVCMFVAFVLATLCTCGHMKKT